jgi:cytochrome c peroxidase
VRQIAVISSILIIVALFTLQASCKRNDATGDMPKQPTPLNFPQPSGWPAPQYDFASNPLTEEGFRLGRKLFYDPRLSIDGTVSCGSCHQQFASFVMFDHDLGHGVNNTHTLRNPQSLINLAWHREMTWDGGVNHIEVQPLVPITAANEMGETLAGVLAKLQGDANYKTHFKDAFGDETINSQRMLKALTQFMLMMVSSNSKYDRVLRGADNFTPLEQIGHQFFQSNCITCHAGPLFTDLSYRNNGRPLNPALMDFGRMRITGNRADSLKFKVPSLRNAALTYPYTHDGTVYSLENMVEHYRTGVVNHASTDPLVRNGIAMTITEKAGLVAFIKALTDTVVTKNIIFSNQ